MKGTIPETTQPFTKMLMLGLNTMHLDDKA